ncbi:conserved hypothetical protein [Shouchella clausii KSM-K16]|uniref:Uncharacterized protein n=1 Tax=Shouchella clausii (strain KSM-K16) TaxID=66692 RepID=Q5WIB4_SHOC1|nr:hypothetical protein [Shouchella clausii]MCZ1180373.1 hypothetical protein [Shouchella clausii]BAD63891.1 conserved hypothetical protein [Shouchella clausii KSM-K16]
MDFDIWYSLASGVIGALVGGIIPFTIYLLNHRRKTAEMKIKSLAELAKIRENMAFQLAEIRYSISKQKEGSSQDLRLFLTHVVPKERNNLYHYSTLVDEKTMNRTAEYINSVFEFIKNNTQKIGHLEGIYLILDSLESYTESYGEYLDKKIYEQYVRFVKKYSGKGKEPSI